KVLANRLKPVLDQCILDNQSAFIPGRSILDNAMAAIKIIHYMKSKARGKEGGAASKSWDMNRIRRLFDSNTVTCIEQTPLFESVCDDTLVWKLEHDGNYSVGSAYNLCVNIACMHDRFRIA
ncbi:RNA-directed DNA polymerase (Reverse transcriptase), partial [Trifolium medium]|nr:RNA-directed DNA polymerase (Reverse transcriptase) [Trifolium medium]